MRPSLLFLALSIVSFANAQNPDKVKTGYSFGLPDHPGRLHFDAPGIPIVQASAKPSGSEFGLRGQDNKTGLHLLAFLFTFPEEAPLTSEKCRDAMLRHEKGEMSSIQIANQPSLQGSGYVIAIAQTTQKDIATVRTFLGKDDLCADIEFSAKRPLTAADPQIAAILGSIAFDPDGRAGFSELFQYANVLFEHQDPTHAAPIYAKALTAVPVDDPGHKWRRVATDQAVMSYGMSGDIRQSRTLAQHAIELDPDYPLNYYNLACADAEEGNAPAAQQHLKQAFARKINTIPGEQLPDPTKDDSILKLKSDHAFWNFVQTLK